MADRALLIVLCRVMIRTAKFFIALLQREFKEKGVEL